VSYHKLHNNTVTQHSVCPIINCTTTRSHNTQWVLS